jgi:hypothetical protein
MSALKIALASILLVVATSCIRTSSVETDQSVSIVGKWVIIGALSRDSRGDIEPEAQTLHFSRDGMFKSWCRVSEKNVESIGEYVVDMTTNGSIDIAVRIKTGTIHPSKFRLTNIKRGNVKGRDDQGNIQLYKDILTFTDHNGGKRAYESE